MLAAVLLESFGLIIVIPSFGGDENFSPSLAKTLRIYVEKLTVVFHEVFNKKD
jgi:hypothetical protein